VVYSAFRELEPYEVKVSRTVLREERGSDAPFLPDKSVVIGTIGNKNT